MKFHSGIRCISQSGFVMTHSPSLAFGSTRTPIEFDPHRLPHLPGVTGALLFAVCLVLALGAGFLPEVLLRLLPAAQSSGANTLLALALLGAAVGLKRYRRTVLVDVLALAAAALALVPVVQEMSSLYPADGPWRLLIETRKSPDVAGYWPGRMALSTSLVLMMTAGCVYALDRLSGARAVKLWLCVLTVVFAAAMAGALGQWLDVPLLAGSAGDEAGMGAVTALALLALVLVLFRLAVGTPAIVAYFDGRPDRSVFALSAVGLLATLVAGGMLTAGLMAGVALQGYREALGESLRTHLLFAEAELWQIDAMAEEAYRRAEAGALDWFVVPDSLAGTGVTVSIEAPGAALAREVGLRLPLGARDGLVLTMRGGWSIESRHVLSGERGVLVVHKPFAAFDLLSDRVAALGQSGELLVCGRGTAGGAERCFPTRRVDRSFESSLVQARSAGLTPMARALAGESGLAEVRDYRQHRVLAAYAPLGRDIAAVLKVDVVELQAPLRRALWGGAVLVALVALAGGAVVYRHVRPLILRLSRTERALNRAQAVARVGSWYANARSQRIVWSDETYRIFGIERGTPMNHERFMQTVHPDDRDRVQAAWQRALGGAPYDIEHRILAGGLVRWVRERAELEFDAAGAMTGATGTVEDVTERKAHEAELLDSRQKLRDLAAHHEKLREEERAHIAREIHDELGQHLTALRMDAALLQLNYGEANPGLAQKVSAMKKLIDRTIKVVRGVASSLRPAALDLGLVSAAEWLVGEFRARTGVACTLELPAHEPSLGDARATVVFRILQESLTNITRHAAASKVEVRITEVDGHLRLEVRDDGVGFDPAEVRERRTFGLMGVRERAIMFGGSASFISRPGEGTRLQVEIPLGDQVSGGDQ